MRHQKAVQPARVYQLKVSLRHSEPLIWRRVLVPEEFNLGQLHRVLQCVMNWKDYHLHQFTIGGKRYGVPDPEWTFPGREILSERSVQLHEVLHRVGQKFLYTYDFGDGWEHDLRAEAILPADPQASYPLCVAGERCGPPEDCGGIWGYENLLEALRNPDHPEHDDMLEWIGGRFDPESFSLEDINAELKSKFRQKTKRKAS